MAVIAVYSVKGGVGKTTIAANLAWCSATIGGHNTLLWDLDPAGGAGFLFGIDQPGEMKAAKIFGGKRQAQSQLWESGYPGLDILPADESLRDIDRHLLALGKKKRLAKLAQSLSETYSRIILDCPPILNETTAQVIRAADAVIVPLPASPLSRRALETVQAHLSSSAKQHPPILPVLSMFDARRNLHKQLREDMPDWPVVPMASAIEQGAERQAPVGSFAARSPGAEAFASLWQAIDRKLAMRKKPPKRGGLPKLYTQTRRSGGRSARS